MTGRAAPWIQPAGKHSASPGPAVWAHTRGGGRQSKSRWTKGRQAKGRLGDWAGWPTSRLGRWTGATQQAGTDVALTRAAISGHSTVGPRPAAARLGQALVAIFLSGRVPATARTPRPELCGAGLPRTILKAKVESLSLHSAATNGSHQLFFPHFSNFLLNAAEPTQVDGNRRCLSGYAGVQIQTSLSRAASQRRLGCEGLPAQSRRRSDSDTDVT